MEPERPITLADVRRASRVFVWLPIGRYWRDDSEPRDYTEEGLGIEGWRDEPHPPFVRVTKMEAARAVREISGTVLGRRGRIVGNTFDPWFFSPKLSGRNLYFLRIHVESPHDPAIEGEWPVTLSEVQRASCIYVRLGMHPSDSWPTMRSRLRPRRVVLPRVRIAKVEALRLLERFNGEYWSIIGTTGNVLTITRWWWL